MKSKELLNLDEQNQEAYDDLIVTIEAKEQAMSLLITVCDDLNLREQIITQYEEELQPRFRSYRITLARGEPSLKAAINQLVNKEEYLRQGGKAIITVTGTEQLYFLKLGNERSEQEIFFGYLQWTREALREFRYPIVLWVTNQILVNLIKKAPDFWSWRSGVFRFVSRKTNVIPSKELEAIRFTLNDSELSSANDDKPYFLPIEDLKELIKQTEQQKGTKDSNLATLYSRLGQIYLRRTDRGEAQNYKVEQDLAVKYFRKAAELQEELGLEKELANSLSYLAELYLLQGRYSEAEPLYIQALELTKRLQGKEHLDVTTILTGLALLYKEQGRYSEVEPLLREALELTKHLLGAEHPDVSIILNDFGELYRSQGRYNEAESLYWQALELRKRILGDNHPGIALQLNNLALLYYYQGRYREAEPLSLQAVEIDKRFLGEENPGFATDLHNLALIYRAQERYDEAENLFLQALKLKQRLLPEEHPLLTDTIYALGNMYKRQGRYSEAEPLCVKALELDKRLLGENHPNVAESLNNLAELYLCTGRFSQAEPLYLQALEICDRVLGADHPRTIAIRENLEKLRAEMSEQSES